MPRLEGTTTETGGEPLVERRARELAASAQILGFRALHQMGYRDSGMHTEVGDGFAHVPLAQITERLTAIFAAERPHVVLTYDPDYAARHPDHQRAYEATIAAFERAGDAMWCPAKLYGTRTHSPRKLDAMHQWLVTNDRPSPYADARDGPDPTTTSILVTEHLEHARRATQAHASQVAADDPWFFAVPTYAMPHVYPYEDLALLASRVSIVRDERGIEIDLFSGIS
jgi:mycothiol S-conjugate amidase